MEWLLASLGIGFAGSAASLGYIRQKGMHRWLGSYVAERSKRKLPRFGEPVHLILCIADHFEPKLGGAGPELARERVGRWRVEYPKLFGNFKDSSGRPPRHSFFYPAEEYEPEYLDSLAELCRAGFGEVEIHLHHDNDTEANMRRTLLEFKEVLAQRHGLLSRDRKTGDIAYAFIHGNWALNNCRWDGRACGVNNEIDVLRETGCYVDMTLPSAPSDTQTNKINSIYWAVNKPGLPKSHNTGVDVGSAKRPDNSLLMIQGPLLLDWKRKKWGLLPRIENACLQGSQAPSTDRLDLWLRACVQVPSRPHWYFVKLHTHGANEFNMPVLLGEPMVRFHEALQKRAERDSNFHYHYVSAREMANLVEFAEIDQSGTIESGRDFARV